LSSTPSRRPPEPARSATARFLCPTSSTSFVSAPAKRGPRPSDRQDHRPPPWGGRFSILPKETDPEMSAKKILSEIKEKDVQYVDLRFTDTKGRMQHVTFDIDLVDEDFLEEGTMFDGSSIAGWKAINESDMLLKPDLNNFWIDPFYQQTTLFLFCDVLNPDTGEPYNRDSRSMAKKALAYVQSSGVGDTVYFGPEAEFFIFDDVRWSTAAHDTGYSYDSIELPANPGA